MAKRIGITRKNRERTFSTNKGFTLAEVLITLGIIGVVAAMTIPTLLMNQEKQSTAVKLSKIYSSIYQGFNNAKLEMGQSQSWAPPATDWDVTLSGAWWNANYIPYAKLSVAKICTDTNKSECMQSSIKNLDGSDYVPGAFNCACGGCYILNDGTIIHYAGVGSTTANIYLDINGKKSPNMWGKDIFEIILDYKAGTIYFFGQGGSRTSLLSDGDYKCNKNPGAHRGASCGALIQMDGWQIKDDYPW